MGESYANVRERRVLSGLPGRKDALSASAFWPLGTPARSQEPDRGSFDCEGLERTGREGIPLRWRISNPESRGDLSISGLRRCS
jgi:hypothetical protein